MIEIAFAFLFLVGAGGTGYGVLSRMGYSFTCRAEIFSFSCAVGFGILILVILGLGMAHLLYDWVLWIVAAVWLGGGARGMVGLIPVFKQYASNFKLDFRSFYFWLLLLAALGLGFNLIRALAPPHGATDPLAYQLALPKIYLQNHYLSFEPTITGALYPTNMGLLYTMALALRNGILAQVLHWTMMLLSCIAVAGFAQRYFSWRVGAWASVLFSFVPVGVIFSAQGYVDLGLCFFQFMALWAVLNWSQEPGRGKLLLAACLTGLAMGFKHQGLATLVTGLVVVATATSLGGRGWRGVKEGLIFASLALCIAAPWYIRSYIVADNPVWPLGNSLFNGFSYGVAFDVLQLQTGELNSLQDTFKAMVPSSVWLAKLWRAPWEWTFEPDGWQKAIGIYFAALLPGILLFGRTRKHALLIGFCVLYYLLVIRFLHSNPRYSLVFLAFVCVLCGCTAEGLGASRNKALAWCFRGALLITFVLNLTWAYYLANPVVAVVFGGEDRTDFLQRTESNYRIFQYANQHLPDSAHVLLQGIVKGYYCDRPYMWDHPFQGVLRYEDEDTPGQLLKRMQELGITHVARMIKIPSYRRRLYPQYFKDSYHEAFRKKYLKLVYHDESYVLFEVQYDNKETL